MNRSEIAIYCLGLLAQLLFSSRILVQWIQSERAGKVLSPTSFWTFSLLASILLMLYGVLRNDIVIMAGQMVSYFIYLRNLRFKNVWQSLPWWVRWPSLVFPVAATGWLLFGNVYSLGYIWEHSSISGALVAWGGVGQAVFTLRFVYQWYYSEKVQASVLPNGFWVISLVGSLMIILYAILRLDPVLFLGQAFGIVAYSRNLMLGMREQKASQVIAQ
ncbi:lauroyl acyltransferase [Rufibacter radiotolerans]|uniref:Lauroyl acyltransferase n=1 Tax=Rufibacter radiotolerans TaxID=1379910 RepID=A0A0H4VKA5_9BACT|nr:lipid-A-disaccharide synthase N-terminal domain-containing protein [Rufibacter radiotolerans]AKQ45783.1 lauroyl acyltransferase [Rufibacter radiotolerans]